MMRRRHHPGRLVHDALLHQQPLLLCVMSVMRSDRLLLVRVLRRWLLLVRMGR
jgi:hypothetical protein